MIKTAFELKTVGALLNEKRKEKNLTYDQVSEIIKINPEYLEAIEHSDYSKFPSEVYVKGFLKNYAKYLGVDPEHASALYRREKEKALKYNAHKIGVAEKIKSKGYDLSISPARIFTVIALLLVFGTIFYIGLYVLDIFQDPKLELSKPIELSGGNRGEFITNDDTLELEGVSEIGNKLTINGQEYRVNSFEQFNLEIRLQEGNNDITIVGENQLKRKSEITLVVLYEPNENITDTGVNEIDGISEPELLQFNVRIEIIGEGAYLEARIDGELDTAKVYPVNEIVTYQPKDSFELFIPRTESINLFINNELQSLIASRVKFQIIDGNISRINV